MTGRANPKTAQRLVGALAMLMSCGACEADAPATQKGATRSAAFEVDILTVRDCPLPPHESLSHDDRLLGVEVEVQANRNGIPANFYYGRLSDSEDNGYQPIFSGCAPRLTSPPLVAGAKKRGFVNFKLPARAQGLTFTYAPRLAESGASPASSVALPLGR